jgi:hypothetical protein
MAVVLQHGRERPRVQRVELLGRGGGHGDEQAPGAVEGAARVDRLRPPQGGGDLRLADEAVQAHRVRLEARQPDVGVVLHAVGEPQRGGGRGGRGVAVAPGGSSA